MKNSTIIFIAKLGGWFIKTFRLGSGSTWPGHIALKLNPNFIHDVLGENKDLKVILVAGTNGKTTTSKLIRFILERNNVKVFQNEEGANLLNGIASSLARHSNPTNSRGWVKRQVAIFEVDENTLPQILEQVTPAGIVLLNLFRDQLDRYGEVNIIADKWHTALKKLPESVSVFLNGDDPQVYFLGTGLKAKVYKFGLDSIFFKTKEIPHDVDSTYCPSCGQELTYHGLSYSHLGDFYCKNCGFKRENVETFKNRDIRYSLLGTYNIYNTYAALLTVEKLFNISIDGINLDEFQPAFGRQEKLEYNGRTVYILLSKNPAGFNQSLIVTRQILHDGNGNVLTVLNDRTPDGTDVSWIWDVDFEVLNNIVKRIFVSGDRVWDMAVRMKYAGMKDIHADEKLETAVLKIVDETPVEGTVVILCTYSAMLEVRKILKGQKLL